MLKCGDTVGEYTIVKRLGSGAYSVVYEASDSEGTKTALKILNKDESDRHLVNELAIGAKMGGGEGVSRHEQTRVVSHLRSFTADDQRCIVYPLLSTHLGRFLRSRPRHGRAAGLTMTQAKHFCRQLFAGLAALHAEGIIHADIKPGNILLDNAAVRKSYGARATTNCYIADLGSSTDRSNIFSYNVGTYEYQSPELLSSNHYDTSTDIWSAAAVTAELFTGDVLFNAYCDCDVDYCVDFGAVPGEIIDKDSKSEDDPEGVLIYKTFRTMWAVLGMPPATCMEGAPAHFEGGMLKYDKTLQCAGLRSVLQRNYDLSPTLREELACFLLWMLKYDAATRPTATEVLAHKFLQKNKTCTDAPM